MSIFQQLFQASRFQVYLELWEKTWSRVTIGLDMHDFVHELNCTIKWMVEGLIFYEKLVDISNKFPFEYLFQIPPFFMVQDVIKQVQMQ